MMIDNVTTDFPPTTAAACPEQIPSYWGYICAALAILFFGTNFAPVKKFETGDGMFFQWVVCCSIWLSGLVVQLIRGSPKFYPLVIIGGVVWETGNICVVPIIKTIGLGLGLCIWGMTNLLSGWATGRFGLFGVNEEIPDNVTLNYIGVGLAVASAFVFSLVKGDVSEENIDHTITVNVDETSPLLSQSDYGSGNSDSLRSANQEVIIFNKRRDSSINKVTAAEDSHRTFIDSLSPSAKRIVGIVLSFFSGILYGQMFTPAIYVQDRYHGASQEGLDYVFSCFCGIFAASTFYFLVYSAFMNNSPRVYPRVILPGFISGIMWAVATSCWFVANKALSEPVAFPIITTGPAVVASLLGVFVFKEIRGSRNLVIMCTAFTVTITGAVLSGLSKKAAKSGC